MQSVLDAGLRDLDNNCDVESHDIIELKAPEFGWGCFYYGESGDVYLALPDRGLLFTWPSISHVKTDFNNRWWNSCTCMKKEGCNLQGIPFLTPV